MSAVTSSVQDENNMKDMLQYTYTLLKNTRPLLKDEEIKIIAEDMVFRVGLKAVNTNQDVFKFGSPATQNKINTSKTKNANQTKPAITDATTDEEKLSMNKHKKRFFFVNSTPKESRVKITLKTERKRSYDASKLNESLKQSPVLSSHTSNDELERPHRSSNNVFERLYSFRRKPSKKNLETVKKIREEEKSLKISKGEPILKKKRISANTSIKNVSSISSNNFDRHSPFRQSVKTRLQNNVVNVAPQLPNEDTDYIPCASSSTTSATSDYQTELLLDEEKFDQEMIAMNKKLERMAVRYRKDISLCQINIDLV